MQHENFANDRFSTGQMGVPLRFDCAHAVALTLRAVILSGADRSGTR
jgi:hypothetical protein